MGAEEKTRVDFNAPASLVDRADAVADLDGESRTQLLIEALRRELDERTGDEAFRRRLREAYYADEVEFSVVESVLGTEDAMRMQLLKESLDRDPPEPQVAESLPSDAAFYDGDVPTWTPDGDEDTDT
ncbi:hypothetical protein EGH24_02360 [Halonotius terrestris]|uniref:Ribbon-helix-helix protein, copG family n=1 Tax=Halonotius terrestris TaxID=2487750 RepID=A0A8J8P9T2_9EURY|nr:hypothetical protein [Halonotius terrestris]TQQ83653.1 hypothetical protein EGH24_02360 [Halonotius terrestris]